jgi:uncharacterized protein (DUF697 family)
MNDSQKNKCHAIIHSTAVACAGIGAGMAQLPDSDNIFIVPLQVGMIVSLGAVFGIELSESSARAGLATVTATMVGRGISQVLVGWIPVWGNALNATTAFAVTQSVGWAMAKDFAARKSLAYQ